MFLIHVLVGFEGRHVRINYMLPVKTDTLVGDVYIVYHIKCENKSILILIFAIYRSQRRRFKIDI